MLLVGLLFVLVGLSAPAVLAHTSAGYSSASSTGETHTDWMALLPDQTRLSQLSIPGTHDSGAYVTGGRSVETQSMNLTRQLNAGIRVWDIRLGTNDSSCPAGTLWVFHGSACQGLKFDDDILRAAESFLVAHQGETLLMRVKYSHGTQDRFAERVQEDLSQFPSLIYTGENDNPTLGEIRGKIVILQDFTGEDIGILWGSLTPQMQDEWRVSSNEQLASKWTDVRDHFIKTATGSADLINVNFLSGSGGAFPYFLASGHADWFADAPHLDTKWTRGEIDSCSSDALCIDEYPSGDCFLGTCTVAFEGINRLAMDYITRGVEGRVGIVMADFPGAGLIRAIIELNGAPPPNLSVRP